MTPFSAPGWIANRHLQTVWAPLMRHLRPLPRRTERLELADGDFLRLDHVGAQERETSPMAILLHGLAGSGDSVYITGMQQALQALGIDSVTMYFRSAGGEPNRLPRSYHAGDTGDLAAVLTAMHERFPRRPLLAIGYSLGGNVLLKYLGERGTATPLRAACAVSAPLDLAACAEQLNHGFARVYRDRLLKELLGNTLRKRDAMAAAGDTDHAAALRALGDIASIRTFREYDQRIIAPLHGFRDADDYYAKSSGRQFLPSIRIPALLVHARDDPFMTPGVTPAAHEVSESVELMVSPHGGHVGFVHGTPWQPRYWLEEAIPGWLAARAGETASADAIISSGPGAPAGR